MDKELKDKRVSWTCQASIGVVAWMAFACVAVAPNTLQLVETTPAGTVLGSADIPETQHVWREMIAGAQESLELCHFYMVSTPSGLLDPIIGDIEDAAERGVRVRFLVGEKFYGTYPELIDQFTLNPKIELRRLNLAEKTGGVQHSKYMVADGEDVYVGSANFDWRAMEHIQELGVRLRSEGFARSLLNVFEMDWAYANGLPVPEPTPGGDGGLEFIMDGEQVRTRLDRTVLVEPAFSPTGLLSNESNWDLPKIQDLIDGAEQYVFLQLLTLDLVDRDGVAFSELLEAIEGASSRGVHVRVLVADWCDREGVIEDLRDLASLAKVDIRMVTIPEHPGGHIPFARVVHAKYLTVDHQASWLGTSNWERGYFFKSRNVGLIVHGEAFADRLEHFFRTNWSSPYVKDVLPELPQSPR